MRAAGDEGGEHDGDYTCSREAGIGRHVVRESDFDKQNRTSTSFHANRDVI
jgi:hypothetical protein